MKEAGGKTVKTGVGGRYVLEEKLKHDYSLGGEQSGHIILKKYATTGDGLLTAIMLTEQVCDQKLSLSKLVENLKTYPQYMENVRVADETVVMNDAGVLNACGEVEKEINGKGRVLLRPSGTEPVIRIMVEGENAEKCVEYVKRIAKAVVEGGYCID